MSTAGKKKVLIIGAGASGMSCADQLAKNPDKFDVTVVEAVDYCGGQAFSIPLNEERHGASWLNQGVQGYVYLCFLRRLNNMLIAIQRIIHLSSHIPYVSPARL